MHDADHDFDFERRSGYNNKTISILTGPSADHTTGVAFQGHYMVINTNTEVYSKTARLISPLYRINAEKLCFEFYYYMYGITIGQLRVYAKPESVELSDILIREESSGVSNEYIVFETRGKPIGFYLLTKWIDNIFSFAYEQMFTGSHGNMWVRGNGTIKQYNESFQVCFYEHYIVIEFFHLIILTFFFFFIKLSSSLKL